MLVNESWNDRSELILGWSRAATDERLETFQLWALSALQTRIAFDHALWGLRVKTGPAHASPTQITHLHHQAGWSALALEDAGEFDELVTYLCAQSPQGSAFCITAGESAASHLTQWNAYANRHGITHLMCFVSTDAQTGTMQVVALGRTSEASPFSDTDATEFTMLAPHLLQAYTTRCETLVRSHRPNSGRTISWTTAIVDTAGHVHNRDADFLRLLETEWPHRHGNLLPEPLRKLERRHRGTRFRHVGTHVVAEFSPVRGLYLMSVRERLPDDALSERERHVAQQYSAGSSYKEIAEDLQVSPSTVRAHVRTVFLKLGVKKKAHLAHFIH